jgi:hypothetical protein
MRFFGRLFTLLVCCWWLLIESKVHQIAVASRIPVNILKSLCGASLCLFLHSLSVWDNFCSRRSSVAQWKLSVCSKIGPMWTRLTAFCFQRGTFCAPKRNYKTKRAVSLQFWRVRRHGANFIARKLWFALSLRCAARGWILTAHFSGDLWFIALDRFQFCTLSFAIGL